MMCAVTALFRVPMPAASILFDVMSCVVLTLIVDGGVVFLARGGGC